MKTATQKLQAKREDPTRTVRFPGNLLGRIDAAASKSGRSRNSEIIKRLWDSLDGESRRKAGAAS